MGPRQQIVFIFEASTELQILEIKHEREVWYPRKLSSSVDTSEEVQQRQPDGVCFSRKNKSAGVKAASDRGILYFTPTAHVYIDSVLLLLLNEPLL